MLDGMEPFLVEAQETNIVPLGNGWGSSVWMDGGDSQRTRNLVQSNSPDYFKTLTFLCLPRGFNDHDAANTLKLLHKWKLSRKLLAAETPSARVFD